MSSQHALLLAYHFPPENAVGAARPFRFYKYLPQCGYRCHVITAANVARCPELDAECVPDPFFQKSRNGMGWQLERSVRKLLVPGAVGIQWAAAAYRAAESFLDQHRGERVVLFSTYPPIGPHAAAWRLAKRYRIPWVADLRDPLAGNPAYAQLGLPTHLTYRAFERLSFADAGCVIANTDEAMRVLQEKYPSYSERFHLIWNGFDPEQRIEALPVPSVEPRLLSHVGELYQGRTVAPLVDSLGRLIKTGRLRPDSFRLQLIGTADESCLPPVSVTQTAQAEGWLKIVPRQVAKSEALHLAQTSHYLLIVQPQSAIQVPGKLFEYLQIGRPVLAFVPRGSSIEGVLRPSGIPYVCLYPDMLAAEQDEAIVSFFDIEPAAAKPSDWFEEKFNAQSQTAALAKLMDALPGP
jgi:Glycosyltransferase Family 4